MLILNCYLESCNLFIYKYSFCAILILNWAILNRVICLLINLGLWIYSPTLAKNSKKLKTTGKQLLQRKMKSCCCRHKKQKHVQKAKNKAITKNKATTKTSKGFSRSQHHRHHRHPGHCVFVFDGEWSLASWGYEGWQCLHLQSREHHETDLHKRSSLLPIASTACGCHVWTQQEPKVTTWSTYWW